MFIEVFAGVESMGTAGAVGKVVKLKGAEYELVPPGFVAFTCQ